MRIHDSNWQHISPFLGTFNPIRFPSLSLTSLLEFTITPCLFICLFCTSRELQYERSQVERILLSDKTRKEVKRSRKWRKSGVYTPALDGFSYSFLLLSVLLSSFISHSVSVLHPSSLNVSGFVFLTAFLLLCQCDRRRCKAVPIGTVDKTVDACGRAQWQRWLQARPFPLHACVCIAAHLCVR